MTTAAMTSQTQKTLIFLHIPKTAGTTFSRILRRKLVGLSPLRWMNYHILTGFPKNPDDRRIAHINALPESKRRKVRLYQGHMGFGIHEKLDLPCHYLAFIRDPIERVISAYHQLQRSNHLPDGMTIEQWVAGGEGHNHGYYIDNGQVRAIAGRGGKAVEIPFEQCTDEHLDAAKRHIDEHFLLVGLSERFDESAIVFDRLTRFGAMYYASANVGVGRRRQEDLAPDLIRRIGQLNSLDVALYDYCNQRLDRQIAELGIDMPHRLAAFQARNRRAGKVIGPVVDLAAKLGRKRARRRL